MEKNWYIKAIENTLSEQLSEIDELKATIAYMEASKDTSEAHFKMLAEYKQELTEAVEDLERGEQYIETMKKYAA